MALGRGLSSLIPSWKSPPSPSSSVDSNDQAAVLKNGGNELLHLDPNLIDPNPYQPRDDFSHGNLEDLINSIKEHGILEPLIVTTKPEGRYELISGERRLRAAKFLNLKQVPAIAREAGDLEKLELALIENLQRQDLNPIEEAEGYRQLMDSFGLTQEETAKRVGKSREAVANTLRLLSLSVEMQVALAAGKITPTHGRLLLQVANPKERQELFQQMLEERLTVKQAEMRGQAKIKRHRTMAGQDPKISGLEDSLREALGTKVAIEKRGAQGKITIDFYSEEELGNIIQKIIS